MSEKTDKIKKLLIRTLKYMGIVILAFIVIFGGVGACFLAASWLVNATIFQQGLFLFLLFLLLCAFMAYMDLKREDWHR